MGITEKIENIVGRLEVITPQLDEYRKKVDINTAEVAVLKQLFSSELEGVRRDLRDLKQTIKDLGGSATERRSRIWDLVLLATSTALGIAIGYKFHP